MVTENKMICEQLTFRPAIISDAPQFVDIMNSQYARKKDLEYFRWQYIDSYEPTVLMCAFKDREMCGIFGLKKRRLNNGVIAGQAIDMLIAPTWRKKGLFSKLAEHAVGYFGTEPGVLCVLANAAGNYAVQKSLGWQNAGIIKTYFLKGLVGSFNKLGKDDSFGAHKARIYFEKKQGYSNWRFDKNPCYVYNKISLEDSIVWVKIFIDPVTKLKYGDIVEFEVGRSSTGNLRNIFYAACDYLSRQNIEAITVWAMPKSPQLGIVKDLGFQETEQARYFCLKILDPKYRYLANFTNWELTEADSEIY